MSLPALPHIDRNGAAQHRFETAARAAYMDPAHRFCGGYAAYEWDHLRLALEAYAITVGGADVLELGCNVGGSSVVLAALGARVSAVDIDPVMPPIAIANLERHCLAGAISLVHAGGSLPFADGSFDLILANSVLEYIEPADLAVTIAELHRVLKPGGSLFICGTASRLALRERHSGRWLVNFLPRAANRLFSGYVQRGLSPWQLAKALSGRFIEVGGGRAWLSARRAIHGRVALPFRAYALLGRLIGRTPGWFSPYIELLLRKL